jgi:hypothetical protein
LRSAGLRSTTCPPKTKLKKKNKTTLKDFAPHFANALLAAALLMSTSGHHVKNKRETFFACQRSASLSSEKRNPCVAMRSLFVLIPLSNKQRKQNGSAFAWMYLSAVCQVIREAEKVQV